MIEEDAGAAADLEAARDANAKSQAETADQADLAEQQVELDAANEELARVEAEEQAKLDAVNEEWTRLEAEEQAKLDAANEELARVEAEEQAKLDAVNEEWTRLEAEEQAKLDAANEELMRWEAEEKAKLDAANEELARVEAEERASQQAQQNSSQSSSQSSSLNLTTLTVAVALVAAVIGGIALQRSRSSGATRTETNPTVALATQLPVPGPALDASIVVSATEGDGRTITFSSNVSLRRASIPGVGPGRDFRGTGTGPYVERFTSDQCPFTITWTGTVDVQIVGSMDTGEVIADIGGPVTQQGDWPGDSCLGGTYYAPNRPLPSRLGYACRFTDVRFDRAGIYKGPSPEDTPNPYGCTLNIKAPSSP